MIGQKELLDTLSKLQELPKFILFCGGRGSGKTMLAKEIARMYGLETIQLGTSVDDVRTLVQSNYKLQRPTMYLLPNVDNMSLNAKNALLKVTEEPQKGTYVVMTIEDMNNTLETIKSRANVYYMGVYTPKEIEEYCNTLGIKDPELYKQVCFTPGDVNILKACGGQEFYDFVEKVVDNLDAPISNVFKISDKIALKDDSDKYDLVMFWKLFIQVCSNRFRDSSKVRFYSEVCFYSECIQVTSKYLALCNNKSINRGMLLDNWIMEMRNKWMLQD